MTHFFNTRSAILALAVSAVSGIAVSSFAGTANAALLDQCHMGTKNQVISCCNSYVQQHGKPFWMSQSRSSCATAVVCYGQPSKRGLADVAYFKKPLCKLESIETDNPGKSPPGDVPPPPPTRIPTTNFPS